MKHLARPLCTFIVLMAIGSSAEAGSYSFVIGGHRIRVEAPRNCRSSACVAVTTSESSAHRRDAQENAAPVTPPPAPVVVAPPPVCAPAPAPAPVKLPPPIIAAAPVPAAPMLAAATAAPVAPPAPRIELAPAEPPNFAMEAPRVEKLVIAPAQESGPPIKYTSGAAEEPTEEPLGQWEAEGSKGTVRIERCGGALCGYALNDVAQKGESVLVNMKPKSAGLWTGSISSHASGNTYYATMRLTKSNKLHVEACAFGRFFCTGNDWTRTEEQPEQLLATSRPSSGARS